MQILNQRTLIKPLDKKPDVLLNCISPQCTHEKYSWSSNLKWKKCILVLVQYNYTWLSNFRAILSTWADLLSWRSEQNFGMWTDMERYCCKGFLKFGLVCYIHIVISNLILVKMDGHNRGEEIGFRWCVWFWRGWDECL